MRGILHHIHLRKRVHQLLEKFPHPNPRIKLLDDVILALAFIMPLVMLPQLWNVWVEQNAEGLAILTWTLFFFFSFPFLLYGIVHKETHLIIMYSLWIIVDALMVIGILIYG